MNDQESLVAKVAEHDLTVRALGTVRVHLYSTPIGEAVAQIYRQPIHGHNFPVRIQSACMYGDTFGSLECDCRAQLEHSVHYFRKNEGGLLIHLPQEGRGAGLRAKALGYARQQEVGDDTVSAYESLGFRADGRSYEVASAILADLGIRRVKLLTNNPEKSLAIQSVCTDLESVPLVTPITIYNKDYLETKRTKLRHNLPVPRDDRADVPRRCVVIGGAVVDHVFQTDSPVTAGETKQAHRYARRPGGKGFNLAVALSRWNAEVSLIATGGVNTDFDTIHDALLAERVVPLLNNIDDRNAWPPQTAVIQPREGRPTYIGWLGAGIRSLRVDDANRYEREIAAAESLFLTQEISEEAMSAVLDLASTSACKILSASPIAEKTYVITPETLDRMDVIVGSAEELAALLGRDQEHPEEDLAKATGNLVVRTSLRGEERYASASLPGSYRRTVVRAPRAYFEAEAPQASSAIGNKNVFTAIFCLSLFSSGSGVGPLEDVRSVSKDGLQGALREGLIAASYVARTDGGYEKFPFVHSQEFSRWRSLRLSEWDDSDR